MSSELICPYPPNLEIRADLQAGLSDSVARLPDGDLLCVVPWVIEPFGATALLLQLIIFKNFNGALGTTDEITLERLVFFYLRTRDSISHSVGR